MSVESRFSENELFKLTNTPYIVGAAMVFSGSSGLATIKEMYANAKAFLMGAKKFPDNEIITGILPNMEDYEAVREQTKAFQEKAKVIFKERGINSPEAMQAYAKESVNEIKLLLAKKATEAEALEYKEWILSIAENVAKAAKEGGFLGFGGELVSGNEKAFYNEIAQILEMDATLE